MPELPLWAYTLNGNFRIAESGTIIKACEGDTLIIEGLWGSEIDEILNAKGIVTSPGPNDGQDLGAVIVLNRGDFIQRYLDVFGSSWSFPVQRETPNQESAKIIVQVSPRTVEAVRITSGENSFFLRPQADQQVVPAGRYTLDDVWTQGGRDQVVVMVNDLPLRFSQDFDLPPGAHILNVYGHTDLLQLATIDLRAEGGDGRAVR